MARLACSGVAGRVSSSTGRLGGPSRGARNHADPAVLLQHGDAHMLDGGHAAAAQRRVQIVERHALAGQVRVEDASVVDQQGRLCLEQPAGALGPERDLDDEVVGEQDDRRADEAPAEGVVRPMTAFWTTLEMISSTTRSKGVS